MRAAVIGSGAFGTALANLLSLRFDEVHLWGRDPLLIESMRQRRENPTYLKGIPLAKSVLPTTGMAEALAGAQLVVWATPSHATRELAGQAAPLFPADAPIVSVSKGIENQTL